MGKIYEMLDPPNDVTCWIGSEYREDKMGRAGGITYVYPRCDGSRRGCGEVHNSCHCRWHVCPGDRDSVRLFIDSEWENAVLPEIRLAKGADLAVLYPDRYRRVTSREFMGILDSSYLVRGYYPAARRMRRWCGRKLFQAALETTWFGFNFTLLLFFSGRCMLFTEGG